MRTNIMLRCAATFFVLAFLILGVVSRGSAGYYPDKDFLKNMEVLLQNAPVGISGERYLRVGETYQEGDVADFIKGYRTQLQEWRLIHEGEYTGNFRVNFWMCWPDRIESWSLVLFEGQLIYDPNDSFIDYDPINSKEAIVKSEKIQNILRTLF